MMIKTLITDEEGVVLLEFVMIAPMMLILIAFLFTSGQILITQSAGYYGAFASARQAMATGANVTQAQTAGEGIMKDAPFGGQINANINCTQGGSNTLCTAKGDTTLAFPIISFNNSVVPSNTFNFSYSMTLPTQNTPPAPTGQTAGDFSGLAGYIADQTS